MDENLTEAGDTTCGGSPSSSTRSSTSSNNSSTSSTSSTGSSVSKSSSSQMLPFIRRWDRTAKSIIMQLSNGTFQVSCTNEPFLIFLKFTHFIIFQIFYYIFFRYHLLLFIFKIHTFYFSDILLIYIFQIFIIFDFIIFQINFFGDHTKIVVSGEKCSEDACVLYINGDRVSSTYKLSEVASTGCDAAIRERLVYGLSCLRQYAELDGEEV